MRPNLRGLFSLLVMVAIAVQARSASAQEPQVFSASGDDVPAAIAAFKAAIGGADNGTTAGPHPTGYRQETWDEFSGASPYVFSAGMYNSSTPSSPGYGLILQPPGYLATWVVSTRPGNPAAPPLFGRDDLYAAYSQPGILCTLPEFGGSGFSATFAVPGPSQTEAIVSGFGAIFIDVNLPNTSGFQLRDIDQRPLGTWFAPASAGHHTIAFLGVVFATPRIASAGISHGTDPANSTITEDATHDLVALDDIIFGEPQPVPPPTITITSPTIAPAFDATGPFLTIAGHATNVGGIEWSNDRGGSGGGDGDTDWSAMNIPIAPGANVITVTVHSQAPWQTNTATTVLHVNGTAYAYHLAEGSTGGFFDTDISIANPNAVTAPVTLTFQREDGGHVQTMDTIAPMSQKVFHVDGIPGMEATAFSSIVTSDNRVPLVVERTMFWNHDYYGGKAAAAIDTPSETWLFAEGVENSFFNTFILLQNPNSEPATATLTFALAFGEAPVVQTVPLPALSRVTIDAGSIPALVGRSFGLTVQATRPIVAERSTYFETTPVQLWSGGHGSPGVTAASTTWLFAEGATGAFRDTFLLLSNPSDVPVQPLLEFFGGPLRYTSFTADEIPPHGRLTVPIEDLHDHNNVYPLAETEFAARVFSAGRPIVAERAMYWIGAPGPWADGTSTFGNTAAGLRWGFAQGISGGPLQFHTYIRLFVPPLYVAGQVAAQVKVTFLRTDGSTIVRNYTVPAFDMSRTGEVPPITFVTIDISDIPELKDQSFGTLIESTNGTAIVAERSMYWNDANGAFWAGGITTAGTRLP